MVLVPQSFADRITAAFGSEGKKWIENLPAVLDEAASMWSLTFQSPFTDLSYSFVVPASKEGREVVLKLGFPNAGSNAEINALRHFHGTGAAELLEADATLGALLLERLRPGKPVLSLTDDEEATRVAGQIMGQLHGSVPGEETFPHIGDWARGFENLRKKFNGQTGPFPQNLIEMAERVSKELLRSMEKPGLLHGDLHHWNILSARRAPWLAIDPKGVMGEPAYETGAWLRNPFPDLLYWDNPGKTISRRVNQFATEFEFERERIIGWGFCQAVLAAWWGFEDNDDDWTKWLSIAQLIHTVT